MFGEDCGDLLAGEFSPESWCGGELEQCPEPGFVGGRAETKQLRILAGELIPELIGNADEISGDCFVVTGELAQTQDDGVICDHEAEEVGVGT